MAVRGKGARERAFLALRHVYAEASPTRGEAGLAVPTVFAGRVKRVSVSERFHRHEKGRFIQPGVLGNEGSGSRLHLRQHVSVAVDHERSIGREIQPLSLSHLVQNQRLHYSANL
jgi:hypothetical protein